MLVPAGEVAHRPDVPRKIPRVPGVETAFRMITIAVALAAGLLIASVVAPSRMER